MKKNVVTKRAQDAAKTREKILESASSLFVQKGFEGVSISEIAKKAKINQSLIYHYFESKEALWKNVKTHLVESLSELKPVEISAKMGLKGVLEQIVKTRADFYEKNPDLIRMMSWQSLEADKNHLIGGTPYSPGNWKAVFLELQKDGAIRRDVDLNFMIFFVRCSLDGMLGDAYEKSKHNWINQIVNSFVRCFE